MPDWLREWMREEIRAWLFAAVVMAGWLILRAI